MPCPASSALSTTSEYPFVPYLPKPKVHEPPSDFEIGSLFWIFLEQLETLAEEDVNCPAKVCGDPALRSLSDRSQVAWSLSSELAEEVIGKRQSVPHEQLGYCKTAMHARRALRAPSPEIMDDAIFSIEAEFQAAMSASTRSNMASDLARCWALVVRLRDIWSLDS
ncbi:hypothetical protein FIU91_02700 [Roseivivax sp. THAF30]|nr:hypothetical protein FIU91_02700 [Roseivivax sp. THAF30]